MRDLMFLTVDWVKLIMLAALMAEASARAGAGLLPLFRARNLSCLSRFGLGTLLGWTFLGVAYLGLACAGLFFPSVLTVTAIAMLCASRSLWKGEILIAGSFREIRRLGAVAALAPFVPLLFASYSLLTPELEHDSYLYHLAVPWQYLQAHRATLANVSWTFHYSLPIDMTFALPLLLGDDRLAKWLVAHFLFAANSVFIAHCLGRRQKRAGWLGVLIVGGITQVIYLLGSAKNDLPSAALFTAGAVLCTTRGRRLLSMVLLGLAASAKMTCLPATAVWLLVFFPRRLLVFGIACCALPLLPWFAKSYLATGDPIYPFGSPLFSSFEWSDGQEKVLRAFLANREHGGAFRIQDLPGVWWRGMSQHYLIVLVITPVLLVMRRSRNAVIACLVAQVLTLFMFHNARYLVPTVWYLALLGSQQGRRLPRRLALVSASVLAVVSVGAMATSVLKSSRPWSDILLSRGEYLRKHLTTYESALTALGSAKAGRTLVVGERVTYRMPSRAIYAGQIGETPLVWKILKESPSRDRAGIKFRQLGATHMVYNFVSARWLARYSHFAWADHMLRTYVDHAKRHHVMIWHTDSADAANGGHCIYRLRDEPLRSVPAGVWFLPGTEQIYAKAMMLEALSRHRDLLELTRRICRLLPEVGHCWNELGHAHHLLGNYARSFESLKRFGDQGMLDEVNLAEYGISALETGRWDQAEILLRRALTAYPDFADSIRARLAQLRARRAGQDRQTRVL